MKSHRKPEKRTARKRAQPRKPAPLKAKAKPIADPGEATLSDVARLIGLPDATLHDHVTKEGLPATKRDGRLWLKWVDVSKFYAHRKGYAPESQRERLAREQADKFALENAQRRSQLVDAVMVDQVLKALAVGIAGQHKTITNRCAHEFAGISDPQRIRERFTEEFAAAGESLAALVGDLASTCERAAQDAAAAEGEAAAVAGPVGRREKDPSEGKR